MLEVNRLEQDQAWNARWIANPIQDHKGWDIYAWHITLSLEAGTASILFGVRDENTYYGCELDADAGMLRLYAMEQGNRKEWGAAAVTELAELPAARTVAITRGNRTVDVNVNEQHVLTVENASLEVGTVGFKTETGATMVIRELRVFDEEGRALHVNRFYDPMTLQFTAGTFFDEEGRFLRLEENIFSLSHFPVTVDSPLFRKSFQLPSPIVKAVARVYSIGWYELRINGRKADNRVLSPANSPYTRRMLYDTYDVTSVLLQGGNAIGLWLGNGYNINYSRWGWKWKQDKAVILQLDIELADGSVQQIVTDDTWRTTASPILMNDIYDGETYDGRKLQSGWDTYEFQDDGWQQANYAEAPEGTLLPNAQQPIRTYSPIEPLRTIRHERDVIVYDFGQNIAGWVKVQAEGPSGSKITLKYSELIDDTGNIDPWTSRRANSTDVYILNGQSIEEYEPRFTYHGFRFVEVSGGITPISIQAIPIHSDVRETGRFTSSNPLLNQIQSNIRWSLLNNFVSIPTDCCQRDERTPCLMDSAVVEEAAIQNFDMQSYYRKWLGDIEDSLGNPDWSGDKVMLPWYLYQYYGDKEVLSSQYNSISTYIDYLQGQWPGRIIESGFGDWCAPNEDGWQNYFHEESIVNTALFYRQAATVSAIASILGKDEDRLRFAALADRIRSAFHDHFHQGAGKYGSGSQTAQVMPLAFKMVPGEYIAGAVQVLVEDIVAKGNHLDTGIYGTRYLMDVLADHGYIDLAYAVLMKLDYPSFGWQIAQGATTLWEQWSFKGDMHSHDHAMFGGIGTSFYTRLAGIQPESPGYETISIRPNVPSGLEQMEASIDTVKGRIVSSWWKEGELLHLNVEIPAQTKAVITLPAGVYRESRTEHVEGPGRFQFIV